MTSVSLEMLPHHSKRHSTLANGEDNKYNIAAQYLDNIISRLQRRATIIYWTIVGTLSVGVGLIVFAGYFASFDTDLLWSRLDTEWSRIHFPTLPPTNSSPLDQDNYKYQRKIADEALTKYWDHYDQLLNASISGYDQKNVFNWVPIALKVSVAGLLIFLVQILIQLYRYNSSLIVFYNSRRYAIIMSEGDLSDTEKWEAVFAPANVDFGRDLRHPFQYVANLLHGGKTPDEGSSIGGVTLADAKQGPPTGAGRAREGA